MPPSVSSLPVGFLQLLQSLGINPEKAMRDDGRVSIAYDGDRCVDCHIASNTRLIFSSRVALVPTETVVRRVFLREALGYATARLKERHDTLALDDDTLVLQCGLDGSAFLEVESGLSAFLDAVDRWRKFLSAC